MWHHMWSLVGGWLDRDVGACRDHETTESIPSHRYRLGVNFPRPLLLELELDLMKKKKKKLGKLRTFLYSFLTLFLCAKVFEIFYNFCLIKKYS